MTVRHNQSGQKLEDTLRARADRLSAKTYHDLAIAIAEAAPRYRHWGSTNCLIPWTLIMAVLMKMKRGDTV